MLAAQVERMLADRRADRFMKDFSEQWLEIRNLQGIDPDGELFPAFDDSLRKAMAKETELFFESQVRENRPLQELLRADYTFLNEQLARHYGITDVYGGHFRRVALGDERRHGLLGHASVLTVTSYANRTSVVLRGKWVLENLLGSPPPPPPPNVPPLKENDGRSKPTALRERMEQHRTNAVCASCHSRMDPLGFALEHFDAVGQWREDDSGAAINSAITLAGHEIDSPKAFREALLTNTDEFVRTVTEKLFIYALGRGLEYTDAPQSGESAATGGQRAPVVVVDSGDRAQSTIPDAHRPRAAKRRADRHHRLGGRRQVRDAHDHHQNAHLAARRPSRPWRLPRAAAARQHGAGAHRAREVGRGAGPAAGRLLRPERDVDAVLVAEGRRRLRESAHAAPLEKHKDKVLLVGGLADEAANLVKGGSGDHARSAGRS